jgi:hypothetical protein
VKLKGEKRLMSVYIDRHWAIRHQSDESQSNVSIMERRLGLACCVQTAITRPISLY